MPAVTLHGAVVERTSHLRYLGIHFDRMLTCRKHAETTALKRKKGLSVLKTMAAKGIKERHLLEMNSRSPHGEAAFFSTLRVPGVFSLLMTYLRLQAQEYVGLPIRATSMCRARACKEYLKVSPDLPTFRGENSDLTSTACVAECHE